MKDRVSFLDEVDLETLEEILSMKKGPEAEGRHLIDLYKNNALSIAEECHDIFLDSGGYTAASYWSSVCELIKRLNDEASPRHFLEI